LKKVAGWIVDAINCNRRDKPGKGLEAQDSMSSSATTTVTISAEQAGVTVGALVRQLMPKGTSWSQARRIVAVRRVRVGGDLCLDPARRLKAGEVFELLARPLPPPRHEEPLRLRHLDEHLVVVEKPAGIPTVRHPAERDWTAWRRALAPTLEDLVMRQIAGGDWDRAARARRLRLRIVHRLDKETSGLVVFARTVAAERGLGRQFHRHTVERRYVAVVPGDLRPQRIETRLVRDRGDGRRGSTAVAGEGKVAVTHVEVAERLQAYTVLRCRLETGRTHQIRIHLAELGHPVCGEKVYNHDVRGSIHPDRSGAPRLALHAAELGFVHPVTGELLHWTMPPPPDLADFIEQLRGQRGQHQSP
jgi:23S rRNA pseudouridine1911/1915/1917 synthase